MIAPSSWSTNTPIGGVFTIHPYPAQMFPAIAHDIIHAYSKPGEVVLDPFCGSGTTLIAAANINRIPIGYDINPYALLIARARLTYVPEVEAKAAIYGIFREFNHLTKTNPPLDIPKGVVQLRHRYRANAYYELIRLKLAVDSYDNTQAKPLALATLGEAARRSADIKHSEHKTVAMGAEQLDRFTPRPFHYFQTKFNEYAPLVAFIPNIRVNLAIHDATTPFPHKANLIVTSPPYGDSRTTVAYGDYCSLSMPWVDMYDSVDKLMLGSKTMGRQELPEGVEQHLTGLTGFRRKVVKAYYHDLWNSLTQCARALLPGGYLALVLADRTVQQHVLPTTKIVEQLCVDHLGLTLLGNMTRPIHRKRIPLAVSPSNEPGETVASMLKEGVLILRKD